MQDAPPKSGIAVLRLVRLFLAIVGGLALVVGLYNGWDGVQKSFGAQQCEFQFTHLLKTDAKLYDQSVAVCKAVVAETLTFATVGVVVGILLIVASRFVGRKSVTA